MKMTGKYYANRMGPYGIVEVFGSSIKEVLNKANIRATDDNNSFRLYTVREGMIVRINRAGREMIYG